LLLGKNLRGELRKHLKLERERPICRLRDLRLELRELRRREAQDIGKRLPVDEGLDIRRLGQDSAVERGDLDEIAEHIVVAHLQ
jgi:hypothetical protein